MFLNNTSLYSIDMPWLMVCWDHFLSYFMFEWGMFSFPAEVFQVWTILAPILGQGQFSLISRSPQGHSFIREMFILPFPSQQRSAAAGLLQILILPSLLQVTCKRLAINLSCGCSPPPSFSPVGKWDKNERWKLLPSRLFFPRIRLLSFLFNIWYLLWKTELCTGV